MTRSFDYATHYFRGFAIVMVMACHYCAMSGHAVADRVFFTSSTHFFLFISGYLCQFLFLRKPQAPCAYYAKKLKNVLAPYALFTLVFTLGQTNAWNWSSLAEVGRNFLLGSAQAPYWYIPFATTLFAVSPLLCRVRSANLVALFVASFVVSLAVPCRQYPLTWSWPGVLYLYSYFLPYYLLGFVYARFKPRLDEALSHTAPWIATLALALYLPLVPDALPSGLRLAPTDLLASLQRLVTIGVALLVFNRIATRRYRLLDSLATCSFSLYFVHDAFFHGALQLVPSRFRSGPVDACVFVLAVLALLVLVEVARRLLGSFSRPLIGS